MSDEIERRGVCVDDAELRMVPYGNTLTGYAAVYNRMSQDLGGFVEIIKPGAFDTILENAPDVLALYNHDENQLLGRTSSGTLRLSSDQIGLRYDIDLPPSRSDIKDLIQRRDLKGSSFGFKIAPKDDKWEKVGDIMQRTIYRFTRLFDVGPVVSPAYLDTTAAMRSLQQQSIAVRSNEWLQLRLRLLQANCKT